MTPKWLLGGNSSQALTECWGAQVTTAVSRHVKSVRRALALYQEYVCTEMTPPVTSYAIMNIPLCHLAVQGNPKKEINLDPNKSRSEYSLHVFL